MKVRKTTTKKRKNYHKNRRKKYEKISGKREMTMKKRKKKKKRPQSNMSSMNAIGFHTFVPEVETADIPVVLSAVVVFQDI